MAEGEPRGVQELALEPVPAARAVFAVARYGMPDRGEVNADLVGPARLQAGEHERVGRQALDDLEMGASLALSRPADRAPSAS